MDEATKKKYCHLLMFDIFEQNQETSQKNDGSDDRKLYSNGSSQETLTATTTVTSKIKSKKRKPRAKEPKRTPRPPNAFILYRKAKQLEVVAQDVPGLLYVIAQALSELQCNIEIALIDTEGETALDVFYLTANGHKLPLELQQTVRESLLERLTKTR